MDDTMKEEKVGKKPKGMVVVISVGKPGGKKPEREADPDTKKKAFTSDEMRSIIASSREKEYPYGNAIYKATPEIMSAGDSARSASMDICKQLHDKGEIAEFPCYTSDGEHGAYDVSFNEKVLNQRFKLSMKWDYA